MNTVSRIIEAVAVLSAWLTAIMMASDYIKSTSLGASVIRDVETGIRNAVQERSRADNKADLVLARKLALNRSSDFTTVLTGTFMAESLHTFLLTFSLKQKRKEMWFYVAIFLLLLLIVIQYPLLWIVINTPFILIYIASYSLDWTLNHKKFLYSYIKYWYGYIFTPFILFVIDYFMFDSFFFTFISSNLNKISLLHFHTNPIIIAIIISISITAIITIIYLGIWIMLGTLALLSIAFLRISSIICNFTSRTWNESSLKNMTWLVFLFSSSYIAITSLLKMFGG